MLLLALRSFTAWVALYFIVKLEYFYIFVKKKKRKETKENT